MNSGNLLTRLFLNYIYSGREWTAVQGRQVAFINSCSIVGISALLGFGLSRVLSGDVNGWIEVIIGIIGVLNVLYLRKDYDLKRASAVILFFMALALAFLFVDGGIAGTGIFWIFTFPILSFFLCDEKTGLLWNIGLLSILALISVLSIFGIVEIHYHWIVIRQIFLIFLAVIFLLYFYTKFSGVNARTLEERTKEILMSFEAEKEKIERSAHQTEETLREKINNFYRATGNLMCIANSRGYFTEINPAFNKVLGYLQNELLDSPFVDFVHPDDREQTLQTIEKLNRGESVENFYNRYLKKDGTYTWLLWNATPHNGSIYAIAHPVDTLIEAQEKLKKKVEETEKLNHLMVGRELAMIEMKKELAALKGENPAE